MQLVDVFRWMLHLMRYIPTTEYRSVIFQPSSPTAHPIYLVNKEEVEEMGRKHILMLLLFYHCRILTALKVDYHAFKQKFILHVQCKENHI